MNTSSDITNNQPIQYPPSEFKSLFNEQLKHDSHRFYYMTDCLTGQLELYMCDSLDDLERNFTSGVLKGTSVPILYKEVVNAS